MPDNTSKDLNMDCAIIDDEAIACDRLKDILEEFESVEVISVHQSFQDALEKLLQKRPRILFLDVELDKNHTAFELIDQLHANCFFPYIILITAHDHYSLKAIKKSVFDYLLKPVDIDELKDTLARLERHLETPYSNILETNSKLSEREREVLELVLRGQTSQEIADLLFVSKSTIDSHRKNILKKTGARSISDLMRMSRVPM
jgi:DNA-binding NarL/FixJ family response regulator